MKIYENVIIPELNNPSYYLIGDYSVNKSLEFCRSMNDTFDESVDFFIYWISDNVSYKHSVVIKSFLKTQKSNHRIIIYSDVDLSKNINFEKYTNNDRVIFRVFDVYKESKGTILEDFKYMNDIKNHTLNPALESDFFRLLVLNKYGGVYIDFDVLLLRDFSPILQYEFMYQWENYPQYNWINGAIMRLKKNSALSILLCEEIKRTPPITGSLCWASELYCKVKEKSKDLIVFPGTFFNTEWQYGPPQAPIKPFIKNQHTNLFDGAFAWHWHNKWNDNIETNSKFDILDKIYGNF